MSKVSIGLRGWRFDEDAVFTDEGNWKPLDAMDEDTRNRVMRLPKLVTAPCDACYLIHGEEDIKRCNTTDVVYGEPMAEVVLCDEHEADFLYWFGEDGGRRFAGEDELRDRFHEWFATGNRAPEGYGGMNHVDTEPEAIPAPVDAEQACDFAREEGTGVKDPDELHGGGEDPVTLSDLDLDLGDDAGDAEPSDDGEDEDPPTDLDDLDLSADYPTK